MWWHLFNQGISKGELIARIRRELFSILRYEVLICLQILKAKKQDHRADLFSRAIKAGSDIQSANRKLLLRMRL